MPNHSQIRNAPNGSRFVRADLHIHSHGPGGSHDVADPTMTPEAIVERAIALGLGVVAITDHNKTGNVERALGAAQGKPLLVVPGVELSTPGGHLLVYAETLEKLNRIVGALKFNDDRTACQDSIVSILDVLERFEGLSIAAHIDRDSGIENAIQGYPDAKVSALVSGRLVALEVAAPAALAYYTERDTDAERRRILARRVEVLGDPFTRSFARVQSSDAHSLAALGRNWAQRERLTRLKVSELNWESFRAAFADPEARVRLEEEIPSSVPRFVGMRVEGGFLDQQVFGFSSNLTCIIGGRGSGKSTALHAIRAVCGHVPPDGMAEADVWPDRVDLVYRTELGEEHQLTLTADGRVIDATDPHAEVPPIAVDCLGQGDMARTIENCGKDPGALLQFLDALQDFGPLKERIGVARQALIDNGERLAVLELEVKRFDEVKKALQFKKHQQDEAKKANGEALILHQQALARATSMRQQLLPSFRAKGKEIMDGFARAPLAELDELAVSARQIAETTSEDPFPKVLARLRGAAETGQKAVQAAIAESEPEIKAFVDVCHSRQATLQQQIDKEVEQLRAKGIQLDLKFLSGLAGEVQRLEERVTQLTLKQKELLALRVARKSRLGEYHSLRGDLFALRAELAKSLSQSLRGFLVDWKIGVTFDEARLSPGGEAALKESMDWRTAAVPKAPALVRALGIPALHDAIMKKSVDPLAQAKSERGDPALTREESQAVIERLSDWTYRRRLEECEYEDLPRIVVVRDKVDANGRPTPGVIKREFSQLSLGQQQSIVLAILLCTKSSRPLLIDQPEDNLDSSFIFQILVRALRSIKEMRQVIVATHNANIAVLGDSDQVIPLKASAERGVVTGAGTVEQKGTRDLVCEILEGGRDAYNRRGRIYGP